MDRKFGRHIGVGATIGTLVLLALGCWREAPTRESHRVPIRARESKASPEPPHEAETATLTPASSRESELAAGAARTYRLALEADEYLHLCVDQIGVDVAVTVAGPPEGRRLLRVDSPNGKGGVEHVFLVAESAGEHRVEIRASDADPGNRYRARIEALRPATIEDRQRAAAAGAFSVAQILEKEDRSAVDRAAERYRQAARLWRELGDEPRQATALYNLGKLCARSTAHLHEAIEVFSQAVSLYRRLGDERREAHALHRPRRAPARSMGPRPKVHGPGAGHRRDHPVRPDTGGPDAEFGERHERGAMDLTVKEAGLLLDCNDRRVRYVIRTGRLPARKQKHRWRLRRKDVAAAVLDGLPKPLPRQHDSSYRLLFSHPKMVEDLIRGFFPEPWVDDIDFKTLEKMGEGYVSDRLDARWEDVVWEVRWHGQELHLCLLIEFQSTIDPYMAVLPPVIPIMIYNVVAATGAGEADLAPATGVGGVRAAGAFLLPRRGSGAGGSAQGPGEEPPICPPPGEPGGGADPLGAERDARGADRGARSARRMAGTPSGSAPWVRGLVARGPGAERDFRDRGAGRGGRPWGAQSDVDREHAGMGREAEAARLG
ncbi:MAG: helix-turn-helix domain-containing protein [bacterium]|nr:helix-turn-helix domain-containing protein [bacterium]